jgi:pimeloyl-ACP methyl ester carboxylesterase/DNA-binding CsgD family transcriptional regulator
VVHIVSLVLRPTVSYTSADDGVAIAYSTFGDGPVPIVVVAPLIGQLEIAWEEPAFEQFITRLAVGATVVLFDRRGSGLSDHVGDTPGELELPRLASDVESVLRSGGFDQAVILGISLGGATAMQFAADHPERTSALVVVGSTARVTKDAGYDLGMDIGDADAWVGRAVAGWGTGASVEVDGPTMAGDARYRAWAARLERHTVSPGGFAETVRASLGYDVRPVLESIRAPTLVLHRRDDQAVPVVNGRYLAEHIPNAAFVELAGVEHTYFLGDQGAMLDAVRAFIDAQVAHGALRTAVRRAERKSAYGHGWTALTPGEREVATLVSQGMTNAEVADRLRASPFTVDGRLRRVFAKLGVSTRVELTAEYLRTSRQHDDRGT